MIIKLDCRETGLIRAVKNYIIERALQNIKVETCNLDVGDIIILDDRNVDIEPQENVIIERKSIKDLAASIRDGRYQEQSFRLSNDPIPNHNIMYLIEGNIEYYTHNKFDKGQKIERKTIYSAITMLQLYKGFSVFRTNSITESAIWLVCMADKMHREKNIVLYFNNNTCASACASASASSVDIENNSVKYSSVIKRAKKSNITTDNISEIMLSQIPGVSANVAQTIMEEHKTLKNFMNKMEEDDTLLDKLMIGKLGRKINKTSIINIKKYLLNK